MRAELRKFPGDTAGGVSFCLRARAPQRLSRDSRKPRFTGTSRTFGAAVRFFGMRSVNAKGMLPCADAFSVNAHSGSATLERCVSNVMKWNASYNMPVFPTGAFAAGRPQCTRGRESTPPPKRRSRARVYFLRKRSRRTTSAPSPGFAGSSAFSGAAG